MKSNFKIGRNLRFLACVAILQSASAQETFDLASDFSASQNPHGSWSFGWVAPGSTIFNSYTTPFNAFGLGLNEWRGPFADNNGSAPPNVLFNPTGLPITVSDTTWLPQQVTFHPGELGERSVIRWTSPLTGAVNLDAAFEGRSGFATSGVEVYQNSALLFSGAVLGTGTASELSFAANVTLQAGDTIDFRVNYGNGDWASDTTQIGVTITAVPEPPPAAFLALGVVAIFGLGIYRRVGHDSVF